MKNFFCSILLLLNFLSFTQEIPKNVQRLLKAYPNNIIKFKDNLLYFSDGSTLVYDDFKAKNSVDLLNNPDIEDQFKFDYFNKNNSDAGRFRNEAFFKKIYGISKIQVEKNLKTIVWCRKLVNQKIRVTNVNNFDLIVQNLSAELDMHPEFKKYISNIGGTYSWRNIAGTNRLSCHSFGMTIDINVQYSDYWQWQCNCIDESKKVSYINRIPAELVQIFEKHGFIWGGKWIHFDTMHFEYRPEFFVKID